MTNANNTEKIRHSFRVGHILICSHCRLTKKLGGLKTPYIVYKKMENNDPCDKHDWVLYDDGVSQCK
jgi:hypothetical protein